MASFEDEGVRGIEMNREAAEEILYRQGWGVLSLAEDSVAQGVPMSFGFDGERLYFMFVQSTEESQKSWYAERTVRASFTVVEATEKHEWASVVVTGPMERVEDEEWPSVREAMEDNAWFPSLFSESEPMVDIQGWSLRVESLSGRQSR